MNWMPFVLLVRWQDQRKPEKRGLKQAWLSQMLSKLNDVMIAILALILLLLLLGSIPGCISAPSRPEPEWSPTFYHYEPINGRCRFESDIFHAIDCDEPNMDEYQLISLKDTEALKEKFNRCEVWR